MCVEAGGRRHWGAEEGGQMRSQGRGGRDKEGARACAAVVPLRPHSFALLPHILLLLLPPAPTAEVDAEYVFTFPDPGLGGVSPPILGFHDVSFNYPGGPTLFKNLNFGLVSEKERGSEEVRLEF